jgi:hypothetical protein
MIFAYNTAGILSLLIGVVLPVIVGYFTSGHLNSGVKATVLALLAGLTAVLAQWLDAVNNSQHFAWQTAVISAFATWLVAEATYFKIWKPSGVAETLKEVGVTGYEPDHSADITAVDETPRNV